MCVQISNLPPPHGVTVRSGIERSVAAWGHISSLASRLSCSLSLSTAPRGAVVDAVVGYCGGEALDPTYGRIGDHTEAIRVTFNPKLLSLSSIYRTFWREHTPSSNGRQYRSVIWAHSQTQREIAEEVRRSLVADSPFSTSYEATAIEGGGKFYRAEEYHRTYGHALSPSVLSCLGPCPIALDCSRLVSPVAAESFLDKQSRALSREWKHDCPWER